MHTNPVRMRAVILDVWAHSALPSPGEPALREGGEGRAGASSGFDQQPAGSGRICGYLVAFNPRAWCCAAMPAAVGHKAAFASLRVLPVVPAASKGSEGEAQAAPIGHATPSQGQQAALWDGRVLIVGRSAAAALPVAAPLASRCSAVLKAEQSGSVMLTDCSRNGTLVLELPEGTALGSSITAGQVDALPWASASMLDHTSVELAAGRPTLLAVGLHRQSWLADAKHSMSAELEEKGAVLLVYQQHRQLPSRWVHAMQCIGCCWAGSA